jgi:DNA modification methylase
MTNSRRNGLLNTTKEKSKLTKEEWREYTKTVWHIANVTHPEHPAVFPAEIPHRLIKLFSFYGETVLDPFAGTGTTGITALKLGRNAVCVDQNPHYVEIMAKGAAIENSIEAHMLTRCVDSRDLSFVDDDAVDLIVTSPPYWDKANYNQAPENLGNVSGYRHFLSEIKPVFEECFRVLRPNRKICVVTANVNQYTEHGLLTFPLATDFTNVLREIGFVMVNELIWSKDGTGGRWGSANGQRPIFGSYPYPPNFLFKNVHEYILIFTKPGEDKKNGAKVRLMEDIMRLPTEINKNGRKIKPSLDNQAKPKAKS